jgi:hypothetical protein
MLSPTLMPPFDRLATNCKDRGGTGGWSHESTIYLCSLDAAENLQLLAGLLFHCLSVIGWTTSEAFSNTHSSPIFGCSARLRRKVVLSMDKNSTRVDFGAIGEAVERDLHLQQRLLQPAWLE